MADAQSIYEILLKAKDATEKAIEKTVSNLGKIDKTAKKANVGLGSMDKTTKTLGKSMATLSTVAKGAVASFAPLIALTSIGLAIKKTITTISEYESALVDMGKVTSESLDKIHDKIIGLDATLGTVTELVQGYYQVISAGVSDPVKALKTLEVSAKAGKSAHLEQAEVIKGLTKVMAGYEGEIKDVITASDLLFTIEKEGQTTFRELIPVIGSMATLSKQLGINYKEMGASMAVLTQTAGTTAEASTRLEALFVALLKPTEGMIKAMGRLGVSTAQQAIAEHGYIGTLKKLNEMVEKGIFSTAELTTRKEALLAINNLSAQSFDVLSGKMESLNDLQGATNRAWGEYKKTLEALYDTLINKLIRGIIQVGEVIKPGMKGLLTILEEVGNVLASIPSGVLSFFEILKKELKETQKIYDDFGKRETGFDKLVIALKDAVTGIVFFGKVAGNILGTIISLVGHVISSFTELGTFLFKIGKDAVRFLTFQFDVGETGEAQQYMETLKKNFNDIRREADDTAISFTKGLSVAWKETQEDMLDNRGLKSLQQIKKEAKEAKAELEAKGEITIFEKARKDIEITARTRVSKVIDELATTFKSLNFDVSNTSKVFDILTGKIETSKIQVNDAKEIFLSIGQAMKSSEQKVRGLTKELETLKKSTDLTKLSISLDIDEDIEQLRLKSQGRELDYLDLQVKGQNAVAEAQEEVQKGRLEGAELYLQKARATFTQLGQLQGSEMDAVLGLETVKEEMLKLEDARVKKAEETLQTEKDHLSALINQSNELKTLLRELKIEVDTTELEKAIDRVKNIPGMSVKITVIEGAGGSRLGGLITPDMAVGGSRKGGLITPDMAIVVPHIGGSKEGGLITKDMRVSNLDKSISNLNKAWYITKIINEGSSRIGDTFSKVVNIGGSRMGGLITKGINAFRTATGMIGGGEVPGYGGGDRIPRWLEAGEYVIRKEAVRNVGIETLKTINEMVTPSKVMQLATDSSSPNVTNNEGGDSFSFQYDDRRVRPSTREENLLRQLANQVKKNSRRR